MPPRGAYEKGRQNEARGTTGLGVTGQTAIRGGVHSAQPHDSGHKHVAGAAAYADDLPEPQGLLHLCLGLSSVAPARLRRADLEPLRAAPGVALASGARPVRTRGVRTS